MKARLRDLARRLGFRRSYQRQAFTLARQWSNAELRRIGPLFTGRVVNVSAWEDRDKQGGLYRDYFPKAASYWRTNYGTSQGAVEGVADELFLDLTAPLSEDRRGSFDVVFNHTTLEHVFEVRTAFGTLCALSSDVVIVVVPWLQPLHADYGDYWRFSPQAVVRLFEAEGLTPLSVTWNADPQASVYVMGVASRRPERWREHFRDRPLGSAEAAFTQLPAAFAGRHAFGRMKTGEE
jgi:hypothetical protein